MYKVISKLIEEWKKNWPNLILQLSLFTVVGGMIGFWVTDQLKPETDISVECEIKEGLNANYTLDISFYNNADFASEDFYIYLWKVTSSAWGSDYSVSEQCKAIRKLDVDFKSRFKIFCDFIPPKSKFGFSIESDLNEEIISANSITIEWWGKTTPYKEKVVYCK